MKIISAEKLGLGIEEEQLQSKPIQIRSPWKWLTGKVHDLVEGPLEDEAHIVGAPPKPAAGASPDKKIDVLLALYNNTRNSIHHWEDRIFHASILTSGAMLSAVAFFLQHGQNLIEHRFTLAAAVLIFGFISWYCLILATKAHANNGRLLVKIEAALGLCESGLYIVGRSFLFIQVDG